MPRNGSGGYSLPEAPFVFDTVISETAMNSNLSDIASALTNSLAKDGQTTPSANLPMGSFRHTGVANASARNDYAAAGQVQDGAFVWCGTAGGTADAITLSPTPAITALAAGQKFRWIAGEDPNTGAMTIAVSGLSAVDAENDGSALAADDHAAGKLYEGTYDGTAIQIQRVRLSPNLLVTANTFTKTQTWTKGSDVASATALTLGDGNYFDITGTTAIESIATKGVGTVVKLHFDDALTLTHHATDMILPGGANITTATGDEAEFVEYAAGDWRCTAYQKASGKQVAAIASSDLPAGSIVQQVNTQTGAVATGTTTLPNDNTTPQNTEGDEYMSRVITPTNDSNILEIDVILFVGHSVSQTVIGAALFQDSTANALAAGFGRNVATDTGTVIAFRHRMTAGTTSATTFKVRAGASSSGTTTFNGEGGSQLYGGVLASSITIKEIAA